jgi:hypothetical protein
MALSVKTVVFWVVTLQSIGDGYQISGRTYCLLLQGKAIRVMHKKLQDAVTHRRPHSEHKAH